MKLILCSIAILLALFTRQAWGRMRERCQNMDLVLMVDSSLSVREQDFEQIKVAMINLVEQLDIGPKRVRVAFLSYSTSVKVGATLEDIYQDKQSLINRISEMEYLALKYGGGTNTGQAIAESRKIIQASPRPEAPRVAVIFTDGASQDYDHVIRETDLLKLENVELFSVGIGDDLNHQELDYIASEPVLKYKKLLKDASLVSEIDFIGETACSASAFLAMNKPIQINVAQNEQQNYQIDIEKIACGMSGSKRFFRIDFDVTEGYVDLVGSYDYVITDKPRTESVMYMMNRHRDNKNLNTFGKREYFVPFKTDRKRFYISIRAYGEKSNSFTFKVTLV